MDGVRLPPMRCSRRSGLKGPLCCLNEARYGIVWGVIGAARRRASRRARVLEDARAVRQADRAFQLVQEKLTDMALELYEETLLA